MTGPGSSSNTGPDLAALREMLAAYDDAEEWKVPGIVRETLDVLSLVDDLRAENERLREACEWYADSENYRGLGGDTFVLFDRGLMARTALAGSPAANEEQQ